jgi:hypothetical protein
MRIQKFSRPGVILMATVVAIVTSMVAANATQTITAPNAAFVSYSLAPGANSAAITPAANRSVLVMFCSTGPSGLAGQNTGVGQVSLLHIPSWFIQWFGFESVSIPTITIGLGGLVGRHIVWLDGAHLVDIQVASADTILIHNGNSVTMAGNVTLVW